jgi:hypothetical protein
MTQQQEQVARSPGEPQTKTGQGTRQSTDRLNEKRFVRNSKKTSK